MKRTLIYRFATVVGVATAFAAPQNAADVRHLTLTEAVHLAVSQNREVKIARLKVTENEQKRAGQRSAYFPSIRNESNILHVTDLQNISIPAGAFGSNAGSLVPSRNTILPQGQNTFYSSGTQVSQPLTQLIRIHDENRGAAADVAISRDDLKNAENQIALKAHSLYYGMLIAQLQKRAAEQQTQYSQDHLRESEDDIRRGSALNVSAIQDRASVLESQQAELTADLKFSDLTTELNELMGLPLDTKLELDTAVSPDFDARPRDEYLRTAWSQNPEILAAEEAVKKAQAGVAAAKTAYIPDVTAFARQSYQDGVPFLVRNFGTFGVNLSWDVFDAGKRRATVRERQTQLAEAEENLTRLKEEVAVSVDRSYNKVERTKKMIAVAQQALSLRQESERLAQNKLTQGVVLISERGQATAATYKAQADFLQANLGYYLAWAELQETVGLTPGF